MNTSIFRLLRVISSIVVVLLVNSAIAQAPQAKVSQMSDQQIMLLWQQAQKTGMSESEAIKSLVSQGMNPEEINSFKKRLIQLQSGSKSKFNTQNIIKDTADFLRDSTWLFSVPQQRKKSPYYGFEFFSNPGISFQPNMNITTPKDYILGIGDKLTIAVTGLNVNSISANIKPEGTIDLPYTSAITLNGLTVEEATRKIKSKLTSIYPALATGQTQLSLTLDNARSIHVVVIGEVATPGTYIVSALASFFNVLYESGGPSQNGSLRKIELIRNNKVKTTIDFYTFLQKGLLPENIRLEDQDIIRFPVYEKRVFLSGEVKRPGIYELNDKETLADLVRYGGGLGDTAYKKSAKVVQIGNQERRIRDVADIDFNNFIPQNADSVFFDKISFLYANRVILTGAVHRPGNYELTEGLTLSKLLKKAEGLKEDAFLNRGYIKRIQSNGDRLMLAFDTENLISGQVPDLTLLKEDSIFIPSKDNLTDLPTVSAGGNVRSPGVFQFRQGMTIGDAIVMAGGFTFDAATHKVNIYRLEKNRSDTLANKILSILTVDVDTSYTSSNGKTLLQPQDYIFVPKLLNFTSLGSVKLRGQVLYEGDYALERRDETVQEVINRAGGISPYASMADVQVFRNKLRVGTTILAGESVQKEKFLLLPGDSIYIPRNEPFVEIKGAVFNPQIISYASTNFKSYISDAGGITDKGNMGKAYIEYSNGINKKIKHFLFFRSYPKVRPGSKIIVPEKTESPRKGLSIIEISAITGTLSALVGLISILKK